MFEIRSVALSDHRAVRSLLMTFAQKEKISYFDLRRRENKLYSLYDREKWCGCAIVSSCNQAVRALCIFSSVSYCTDENHSELIDALEKTVGIRPAYTELVSIDSSVSLNG